jgi:hypothetical protein
LHEKTKKFLIDFFLVCPIPWLCIFKMQNHPSKFGIHWWRCITLYTQARKMQLKQELHNLPKTRWTLVTTIQKWRTL